MAVVNGGEKIYMKSKYLLLPLNRVLRLTTATGVSIKGEFKCNEAR